MRREDGAHRGSTLSPTAAPSTNSKYDAGAVRKAMEEGNEG